MSRSKTALLFCTISFYYVVMLSVVEGSNQDLNQNTGEIADNNNNGRRVQIITPNNEENANAPLLQRSHTQPFPVTTLIGGAVNYFDVQSGDDDENSKKSRPFCLQPTKLSQVKKQRKIDELRQAIRLEKGNLKLLRKNRAHVTDEEIEDSETKILTLRSQRSNLEFSLQNSMFRTKWSEEKKKISRSSSDANYSSDSPKSKNTETADEKKSFDMIENTDLPETLQNSSDESEKAFPKEQVASKETETMPLHEKLDLLKLNYNKIEAEVSETQKNAADILEMLKKISEDENKKINGVLGNITEVSKEGIKNCDTISKNVPEGSKVGNFSQKTKQDYEKQKKNCMDRLKALQQEIVDLIEITRDTTKAVDDISEKQKNIKQNIDTFESDSESQGEIGVDIKEIEEKQHIQSEQINKIKKQLRDIQKKFTEKEQIERLHKIDFLGESVSSKFKTYESNLSRALNEHYTSKLTNILKARGKTATGTTKKNVLLKEMNSDPGFAVFMEQFTNTTSTNPCYKIIRNEWSLLEDAISKYKQQHNPIQTVYILDEEQSQHFLDLISQMNVAKEDDQIEENDDHSDNDNDNKNTKVKVVEVENDENDEDNIEEVDEEGSPIKRNYNDNDDDDDLDE